jgi:hypothetical protein
MSAPQACLGWRSQQQQQQLQRQLASSDATSAPQVCLGWRSQQQQQQQRQQASSDATSAPQGTNRLGKDRHQQQQQQQSSSHPVRCVAGAAVSAARKAAGKQQRVTRRPHTLQSLLLLLCCFLALCHLQPVAAAPSPVPAGTPATAAAVIAAAPPDVPRLELQKWNGAFRMYVSLITPVQQQDYEIINMDKCSSEGFDSVDPGSVALEACFYKQFANGSYAYWIKKPGAGLFLVFIRWLEPGVSNTCVSLRLL